MQWSPPPPLPAGASTEIIGRDEPFAPSSDDGGDPGEVASFVKKPASDPQEAALDAAEEEVRENSPEIEAIEERSAQERDFEDEDS